MEVSLFCRISNRPSSRIRVEIQANCVKNRSGACVACGKLASVERKIDEARRVLNRLLDEREELACTLNDHHDPLTNRLPTEVVTNIFLHCQPPRPDSTNIWSSYRTKSLLQAVLHLGHVCRQWRTIAQHTPRLWSVLCIDITRKTCIRSIEMAQHWLRHSASAPLYAKISAVEDGPTIKSFALKLFALIATTAHRWEALDLVISGSLIHRFSEILSQRKLRLLDVLKLNCFKDPLDGLLSLNASPRVIINNGGEGCIQVGMERLVHFNLCQDTLALDGYIRIFRTALGLTTCVIAVPDGYAPVKLDTPVEAPSLHTITARNIHGDFWDHFIFPQLRVLQLEWHTAWRSLESLLRRSQCSITELQLDIGEESLHIIVGLFEHLPHLDTLVLELPSPYDFDFFSLLDSLCSSNFKALSKLASLSCTVNDPLFDWSPLLVFLTNMTSRSEPSLRSFVFHYENYYDHDDDEEEGNWNEDNTPLPMDAQMMRLAFDATRNMEEAIIYDLHGNNALQQYLEKNKF